MNLVKCKDCGTEVSPRASACPKCGAPIAQRKTNYGWLTAVLFLFFVAIAIGYYQTIHPPETIPAAKAETGPSGKEAFVTAQEFIRGKLKAPRTAKFSVPNWDEKTAWKEIKPHRWAASGFVDAQNSFGAMIRDDWFAVLDWTGTNFFIQVPGRWEINREAKCRSPAVPAPPTPQKDVVKLERITQNIQY